MKFAVLLALTACAPISPAQSRAADASAVDERYLTERVTGDYVEPGMGYRMWISKNEVIRVQLQARSGDEEAAQTLSRQSLMRQALTLPATTPSTAVRDVLSKLKGRGVTVVCARSPVRFLVANAAAQTAVFRYLGKSEDETLDTRVQGSGVWSATYVSFRSRQLARVGALPAHGDAESDQLRTAALDDLPFTAPSLVFRIAHASRPVADWCQP